MKAAAILAAAIFAVLPASAGFEVAKTEDAAIEVRKDGKPFALFRPALREAPPDRIGPPGARFARIGKGTLVGTLRLAAEWSDYKGSPIPAGEYTLRYLVLPEDGNHMGVALHRDFLLLSKKGDDPGAAAVADEALLEASWAAAGRLHPAVLAVFPVPPKVVPPAIFENELGQPTLALEIPSMRLGLVLEGKGEF